MPKNFYKPEGGNNSVSNFEADLQKEETNNNKTMIEISELIKLYADQVTKITKKTGEIYYQADKKLGVGDTFFVYVPKKLNKPEFLRYGINTHDGGTREWNEVVIQNGELFDTSVKIDNHGGTTRSEEEIINKDSVLFASIFSQIAEEKKGYEAMGS